MISNFTWWEFKTVEIEKLGKFCWCIKFLSIIKQYVKLFSTQSAINFPFLIPLNQVSKQYKASKFVRVLADYGHALICSKSG